MEGEAGEARYQRLLNRLRCASWDGLAFSVEIEKIGMAVNEASSIRRANVNETEAPSQTGTLSLSVSHNLLLQFTIPLLTVYCTVLSTH